MWGGLTVEKSTGQVRPFAGITVGKKSTDAYDETGDVQATLNHASVDETYLLTEHPSYQPLRRSPYHHS